MKHAVIVVIIVLLLSACAAPTQAPTATPVPPTATFPPTATVEPSPTATEKPMTLQEKVDAFAAGQIEFPSNLSPEEYSAFIDEMNNHVGRQAIWVETFKSSDRSPAVLYFDVAQSKMVALPGTYAENKEIIDKNQIEMFVKIGEEAETGNLQYTNSKGELITSPNSADVNWNLRVDISNYKDGSIDLPEVIPEPGEPPYEDYWGLLLGLKDRPVIAPGILIDDAVSMLTSLQGKWLKSPCLNILFIVTDEQGKPLYGIRTFVGETLMYTVNEGGTLTQTTENIRIHGSGEDEMRKFEAGAVYYISLGDQQLIWEEDRKESIDELQGISPVVSALDNALNQRVPDDGNIVLLGMYFIKKQ